jgi:hypothetical protein
MKPRIVRTLSLAICSLVFTSGPASAAYDPCYGYQVSVNSAQRNLTNAQNNVTKAENNFYRAVNQVETRTAQLEATVAQREAFVDAVGVTNRANTGACLVRGVFFRWGWRNCGNIVANNSFRRAQARAQVNIAQSNLNSYRSYSANYLRRMALQVDAANAQATKAQSDFDEALAEYQSCLQQNSGS